MIEIDECLAKYLELGEFFNPDYGEGNEVLIQFKKGNKILNNDHIDALVTILEKRPIGRDHYFVADLLYLYRPIPLPFFQPMIDCGIDFKDPSSNRSFLRPCLRGFGEMAVAQLLLKKFNEGDKIRKIGIMTLLYWFRSKEEDVLDDLIAVMIEYANKSDLLAEKYFYRRRFGQKIQHSTPIPDDAYLLKDAVKNDMPSKLFLRQLGWKVDD